jgi:hypothetical protein
MGGSQFVVLSSGARTPRGAEEEGASRTTLQSAGPRGRELRERISVEAMKVYHLTIQENGHSRRFVYEDRDQALARLAEAIAAGLDARLDEVLRDAAGLRYSALASSPSSAVEKSHERANGIGTPAG